MSCGSIQQESTGVNSSVSRRTWTCFVESISIDAAAAARYWRR